MSEQESVNPEAARMIGKMMRQQFELLCVEHAKTIYDRLYNDWLDNEKKVTQLTIEPKFPLVINTDGQIQVSGNMKLVKKIPTTFDVDPICFNPNQPDLFNGSDPVIPEAGNQPPEAEDPIDKMEVGPDNKDLEEGQQEEEAGLETSAPGEEDTEPIEQPVDTAPAPEEVHTTDNDEQVGGEDVEKVDDKVVEEVVEENTLPEDSERCEVTHPKCKELRCILPKGHEEGHKLDICGEKHKDGVRVCIKPKGHDGQHKYADLTM